MFTRKLHLSLQPTHVYKLGNREGQMVSQPKEVLQIFTSYYEALLSAPNPGPESQEAPWLASLHLPTLMEEQLQSLNGDSYHY